MNSILNMVPMFLDIQDDLIIPNLINKGNDIIIPIDNNDNINNILIMTMMMMIMMMNHHYFEYFKFNKN